MTKSSDRYARWFGTRVPLLSRGGIALLTLLGAIPFSVLIFYRFIYTIYGLNLWIVIGVSLGVGFLFHILVLLGMKFRFNNPPTNPEFLSLISQIHQRVVISSRTHIWIRQSADAFIASIFNPIYNAVVLSRPMLDLILQSPESGEVLLAFHLLRVPRRPWFGDLIGASILFAILTFLSATFLVPLSVSLIMMLLSGYFYGLYLILNFATFLIIPIVFVLLIKGAFWRHEPAFVDTESIYGMHPQVAKVQVEQGVTLIEEEVNTVIYGVRDWEKNKRSMRRLGVSVLLAAPSLFLGLFLIVWIGYIPYGPYYIFYIYFPYIFAGTVAAVSYLLLRYWDKKAVGEVFQKTTDYDEPIWVD
ncbi:MAG: hypothetical protein ACFFFK_06960 [Candidatus Thorarchaeota archaeon]